MGVARPNRDELTAMLVYAILAHSYHLKLMSSLCKIRSQYQFPDAYAVEGDLIDLT